jgi:hypothetical protein
LPPPAVGEYSEIYNPLIFSRIEIIEGRMPDPGTSLAICLCTGVGDKIMLPLGTVGFGALSPLSLLKLVSAGLGLKRWAAEIARTGSGVVYPKQLGSAPSFFANNQFCAWSLLPPTHDANAVQLSD